MTKEPNKDFRQAVREVMEQIWRSEVLVDEATTRILALCKEMLVPAKPTDEYTGNWIAGWNECRQHLLKQLGEAEK